MISQVEAFGIFTTLSNFTSFYFSLNSVSHSSDPFKCVVCTCLNPSLLTLTVITEFNFYFRIDACVLRRYASYKSYATSFQPCSSIQTNITATKKEIKRRKKHSLFFIARVERHNHFKLKLPHFAVYTNRILKFYFDATAHVGLCVHIHTSYPICI